MRIPAFPLLPFSLLYAGITRTRNWLYDHEILASTRFPVPIINVGNLTVGGTGKTPHVEYLVRLLQFKRLAILSRGYKRQTKGFVLAAPGTSAQLIGDEPYGYYEAFPEVTVAVSEDRVLGIKKLLAQPHPPEIILLDDAFQHRPVKATLNILITDYQRLFYRDYLLPAGRLRESRFGAQRADIIVVSKSPANLAEEEQAKIRGNIIKYAGPGVPVFFTRYLYQAPVNFGLPATLKKNIILVTGIAQPQPLLVYLKEQGYQIKYHYNFPDHHAYTRENLKQISNFVHSASDVDLSILTTQKDWTKLSQPDFKELVQHLPLFYIPIQVAFLENPDLFKQLIFKTAVIAK